MKLKTKIENCVEERAFADDLVFTVALREDQEEGGYIAECLDMPDAYQKAKRKTRLLPTFERRLMPARR